MSINSDGAEAKTKKIVTVYYKKNTQISVKCKIGECRSTMWLNLTLSVLGLGKLEIKKKWSNATPQCNVMAPSIPNPLDPIPTPSKNTGHLQVFFFLRMLQMPYSGVSSYAQNPHRQAFGKSADSPLWVKIRKFYFLPSNPKIYILTMQNLWSKDRGRLQHNNKFMCRWTRRYTSVFSHYKYLTLSIHSHSHTLS